MLEISDVKFTIRLPKSSRAAAFMDVQQILNTIPYKIKDKFILVEFEEKTKELKELVEVGRKLTAFKLFINDEPIDRSGMLHIVRWAIFCPYSEQCNGICMVDLRSFGFQTLQDILQMLDPSKPYVRRSGEYDALLRSDYRWLQYIEGEEKDHVQIDHDILGEDIRRDLQTQEKYCDIFNWEAIEGEVQRFPKQVEVVPKVDNWDMLFYYLETVIPEKLTENFEKILRQLFEEAGFIESDNEQDKKDQT